MTVGDRIKYYRERSGLTQQELADMVGVKFPAISKYELGTVDNLPLKKIEALANALGVTGGVLLGWEEEPKEEQDDDRQKLHRLIDTASDDQLKIIELLLSLPTEQIEALAALLRAKR